MKKILYTMLVALMTAFTFTSCEDVPAPYDIPNGGNGGGSSEMAGNGTAENPYTVEDIKSSGATGSNVYVKAYIVGFVPGKAMDEAKFTAEGCEATSNVLIAASPDETSVDNVMPVQLPVGAVRDAINLKDNPANLKQEVVLCGNIEAYFGKTGLKAVVWAKLGDKEFGAKPGTETGGGSDITGTPKGTGTKDDPFNSVAANQMASKLASGAKTDKQYYIKGKVVSVKEAFSAQFGNASFYISDDGKEDNKFYVFRTLYLGNEKWTEGKTNVAVGDEVVVCGSLVNYMGNTPETVQGETYLVSLKSNGGGTETPDTPGDDIKGDFEYVVANCGLENATKLSTLTLTDGLTLTFDGGGNNSVPSFYTTGNAIRIYPKNTIKFESAKSIESLVFVCDEYNGALYNASGDISSTSGKTTISGSNLVISGINSKEFTLTNTSTVTGAPSQLRFTKVIVTYKK